MNLSLAQPQASKRQISKSMELVSNDRWTVRELSDEESLARCFELRFDALCAELGYCNSLISTPKQMRDRYDVNSIEFGIFNGEDLAAVARLVYKGELPTQASLPKHLHHLTSNKRIAEISRIIVNEKFRHQGLVTTILSTACILAIDIRLTSLLISERSNESYALKLRHFGFEPVHKDYWFRDQRITPTVLTTTYVASPLKTIQFYRQFLSS